MIPAEEIKQFAALLADVRCKPRKLRTGWRRLHGMKGEVWLSVHIVYPTGSTYITAATCSNGVWTAHLAPTEHVGAIV